MTPFRNNGTHSAGPSTYGSWVRTYNKLFSCKSVLTVTEPSQMKSVRMEGCHEGLFREFVGTCTVCCTLRIVEYDHWPYSPARKYSKQYQRITGVTHVTHFRRNGKYSIGPSTYEHGQFSPCPFFRCVGGGWMISVRTEGCHVGHSGELAGTVCCIYGQAILPMFINRI